MCCFLGRSGKRCGEVFLRGSTRTTAPSASTLHCGLRAGGIGIVRMLTCGTCVYYHLHRKERGRATCSTAYATEQDNDHVCVSPLPKTSDRFVVANRHTECNMDSRIKVWVKEMCTFCIAPAHATVTACVLCVYLTHTASHTGRHYSANRRGIQSACGGAGFLLPSCAAPLLSRNRACRVILCTRGLRIQAHSAARPRESASAWSSSRRAYTAVRATPPCALLFP